MSGDEVGVVVVSGCIALVWAIAWAINSFSPPQMMCSYAERWPIWLTPFVCDAVLLLVLLTAAADDVRTAPEYIALYFLLGVAWIGLARRFTPLFGLYPRQDIVERRNPAAGFTFAGLLVGLTLCYAGANIGNGPGWWVVVFSALLSTAALYLLWLLLDILVGMTDVVTINRDVAAGLRLGAFFVAAGLILGRAVAGNWVSAAATLDDFRRMAWPVLVLFAAEVAIGFIGRPSAQQPQAPRILAGLLPGMVYIIMAAAYVQVLGDLP